MEQDTFKPESLTITQIFCDNNAVYKVPDYQRRYSWQKEQLEALWDDLFESYENKDKCYFLGSIVVVKNKNNYFELIDGQQRLTTLMIMISVLYKTFKDLNCPNPDNIEDESSLVDSGTLKNCLFFKEGKRRLTLQTAPKFDSTFNKLIIDTEDFSSFVYPSKSELKRENPEFNYKYTAKFFYDKFANNNDLSDAKRNEFIFYLFNNVMIIRITCNSVPFAIKLFQVMNDRGMPLNSSDIIKSYIMGRIEKESDEDKDSLKAVFNSNWGYIEKVVNDNDLKMDDFMIYYEYFKLQSNPKRQVVDELKTIIENTSTPIKSIIDEMKLFADSLSQFFSKEDTTIYSLRYLPWNAYINTCLTSAIYSNYGIETIEKNGKKVEDKTNQNELFKEMRRYFYLAFIAGNTLAQIKQTSFNLLKAIIEKKPLSDIKSIFDKSISHYKMIKGTYESLEDDIYGENFLKPLLVSIEYEEREKSNKSFITIDRELHADHILPQGYKKNTDWSNIADDTKAEEYMHKIGNLAILNCKKNEEALNKGFVDKCNIYLGKSKDGKTNVSGVTCFDTTKEVAELYTLHKKKWDINAIQDRQKTQISRIEKMLNIDKSMIQKNI